MRDSGTTGRRPGSGRPRSARTDENIDAVNELVLSQEGAPNTHRTTRQIARETQVHRSSVRRIIHKDLRLKCVKKRRAQELTAANCAARVTRAKKLLCRFPASAVDFIFFYDEKILRWRHQSTSRMTASTCHERQRNVTLMLTDYWALVRLSAGR